MTAYLMSNEFATFQRRNDKSKEALLAYPISRWIQTRPKPNHPIVVNLRRPRCASGSPVLLPSTDIAVLIAAIKIIVPLKKSLFGLIFKIT